jgi:hypothetical protein
LHWLEKVAHRRLNIPPSRQKSRRTTASPQANLRQNGASSPDLGPISFWLDAFGLFGLHLSGDLAQVANIMVLLCAYCWWIASYHRLTCSADGLNYPLFRADELSLKPQKK